MIYWCRCNLEIALMVDSRASSRSLLRYYAIVRAVVVCKDSCNVSSMIPMGHFLSASICCKVAFQGKYTRLLDRIRYATHAFSCI